MARIQPFEEHAGRYDEWFERNRPAYLSELEAVRSLLPDTSSAVEVGVGTGRFAAPLGISTGVEPAEAMARVARRRGIRVIQGVGERLPLEDASFELVTMITTICFMDDVGAAFAEAHRVLVPRGHLVVGFLDRASELGRHYDQMKSENVFYSAATFRSSTEVLGHLESAGFRDLAFVQTIFELPSVMSEVTPVRKGYGDGLFVVARGCKLPGGTGSAPGGDINETRGRK